MFQKVPEATPNMRGFVPFWFRQMRGHSVHYKHRACCNAHYGLSFGETKKGQNHAY